MPVPRDARRLRLLRWAEGTYAACALLVVTQLPPPGPTSSIFWVHLLGTAILAGMLAAKLRKPNHATWWVAAILAAYVLGVAIAALLRSGGHALPTAAPALALYALLNGSQVAAAACLSGLRHLSRTRS